jgi:DNA repair protein RecO (recombination protein O)
MRSNVVPAEEIRTPAVVVRTRAFAESDKIVTFLTRDLGKVSGIAKGAKRSKRRFVNVLEPFTHVHATLRLRPHTDLAFVAACELLDAHHSFTRDLDRFAHASYILELTDRMVQGHEAGQATYELVRDGLGLLDRHPPEAGMLRAFELHLLRLTGYEPIFHTCQGCGATLATVTRMYVQPLRGGARCPTCRAEGRAFVVSRETLERLVALQQSSFADDDASRFRLPASNAAEVRALVRSFFAGSLTKPLASERLLEGL